MQNIHEIHPAIGLAPVADAFAGTVVGAYINTKNYSDVAFLVVKGAGATGTSTITVEIASDVAHTGLVAIPFLYRRITTDVGGALVRATAAGFDTTAGAAEMYLIFASTSFEGLADGAKPFVRVKAIEVVDSPVAGAIIALASGGRYGGDLGPTALA